MPRCPVALLPCWLLGSGERVWRDATAHIRNCRWSFTMSLDGSSNGQDWPGRDLGGAAGGFFPSELTGSGMALPIRRDAKGLMASLTFQGSVHTLLCFLWCSKLGRHADSPKLAASCLIASMLSPLSHHNHHPHAGLVGRGGRSQLWFRNSETYLEPQPQSKRIFRRAPPVPALRAVVPVEALW